MASTVEDGLYAKLVATSAVTALVSARIYPQIAPQSADLPLAVYQVVAEVPENHSTGDTGTHRMLVQVGCWATTQASAKAIGDAIETALVGWTDADNGVGSCLMQDRRYNFEAADDGSQTHTFGVSMDFAIWHT